MTRRKRQNQTTSSNSNHKVSPQGDEFFQQVEALIPAEVRMISGCHSEQTSADVTATAADGSSSSFLPDPRGKAGGACTRALLDILHQHTSDEKTLTFQQLLLELRASLANDGFDQVPQLTSSRPLDMEETPFSMVGSDPHGRRRALLVGINYEGQSGELKGCHNDALNMKEYLVDKQGYLERDVILLLDDGNHHQPTKLNIITVLQQLVLQSKSGDSIVFHYSGHGGLLESHDCSNLWKQAANEYDEFLYPLDHHPDSRESDNQNIIRDFSLFDNFVKPLKKGVTVNCIIDCCHSGSVLDLPYSYKPTSTGLNIDSERRVEHLYNLAFLYLLSGGVFPPGDLFEGISASLEGITGESVANLQGSGMDGEDAFRGVSNLNEEEEAVGGDNTDQLNTDAGVDDENETEVVGGEQSICGSDEPLPAPASAMEQEAKDVPQPSASEFEAPTVESNPVSASDAAGASTFDIRNSTDLGSGDYTAMGSVAFGSEDAAFSADEDVDCGCLGDFLQNLASDE